MDSYTEVRRVRKKMSESVDHDVRKLIASINKRRSDVVSRIIDPGTTAERCAANRAAEHKASDEQASPPAL